MNCRGRSPMNYDGQYTPVVTNMDKPRTLPPFLKNSLFTIFQLAPPALQILISTSAFIYLHHIHMFLVFLENLSFNRNISKSPRFLARISAIAKSASQQTMHSLQASLVEVENILSAPNSVSSSTLQLDTNQETELQGALTSLFTELWRDTWAKEVSIEAQSKEGNPRGLFAMAEFYIDLSKNKMNNQIRVYSGECSERHETISSNFTTVQKFEGATVILNLLGVGVIVHRDTEISTSTLSKGILYNIIRSALLLNYISYHRLRSMEALSNKILLVRKEVDGDNKTLLSKIGRPLVKSLIEMVKLVDPKDSDAFLFSEHVLRSLNLISKVCRESGDHTVSPSQLILCDVDSIKFEDGNRENLFTFRQTGPSKWKPTIDRVHLNTHSKLLETRLANAKEQQLVKTQILLSDLMEQNDEHFARILLDVLHAETKTSTSDQMVISWVLILLRRLIISSNPILEVFLVRDLALLLELLNLPSKELMMLVMHLLVSVLSHAKVEDESSKYSLDELKPSDLQNLCIFFRKDRLPRHLFNLARQVMQVLSSQTFNLVSTLRTTHSSACVVAFALSSNNIMDVTFTPSFYKHMIGDDITYHDMKTMDHELFNEWEKLLQNPQVIESFGLWFRDNDTMVTKESVQKYIEEEAEYFMTGAIDDKLLAFLKGFHELIPPKYAAIFNAEELRDAMSGMPTIHVEALKQTAIYVNYVGDDVVIQWFWEVLESFEHCDKAKFLGFVTGTQRVPSDGLELTIVRSGATNRLPAGHTCAKQLDLPRYSTKEQLRDKLLKAIQGRDLDSLRFTPRVNKIGSIEEKNQKTQGNNYELNAQFTVESVSQNSILNSENPTHSIANEYCESQSRMKTQIMLNRHDPKAKEDGSISVGGEDMSMAMVTLSGEAIDKSVAPGTDQSPRDEESREVDGREKEKEAGDEGENKAKEGDEEMEPRKNDEEADERAIQLVRHTKSHAESLLAFEAIPSLRNHFRENVSGARSGCPRMCKMQYKRKSGTREFSLNAVNDKIGNSTKDIESILVATAAEKKLLETIWMDKESCWADDDDDAAVDRWTKIKRKGKKQVFFEEQFGIDFEARTSRNEGQAHAESGQAHADSVEATGATPESAFQAMEGRLMNAVREAMKEMNEKVTSLSHKLALLEEEVKSLRLSDKPADQDAPQKQADQDAPQKQTDQDDSSEDDESGEDDGSDNKESEEEDGSDSKDGGFIEDVTNENQGGDGDMDDTDAEMYAHAAEFERKDDGNEAVRAKSRFSPVGTRSKKAAEKTAAEKAPGKKAPGKKTPDKKAAGKKAAEEDAAQKKQKTE
ncbi:hypothetical protein Bca52824_051136 [Brassica carinata]|uniref:HECT-type E3 ubiquitin transferase n=1 Tax=Brassica carinata TaxID=52824 RepID=A0A8X7UJI7_BRACI|nr:hypothetical protein Bca52824_051136 [Brassica carinata]